MNNNLLIDIVLPNYNKKLYLEETIQSVINQSYEKWNLIIIDNNSTDGSSIILKKYDNFKKINIIKLKKIWAYHFQENLGLRLSENEYVAFLDSDDLWDKENLILKLNLWKKTIIYLLIVIIHHSIYIKIIRFIQKQLNQKNILILISYQGYLNSNKFNDY